MLSKQELKAVKRWYQKNGMDYIAGDWETPRLENGETGGDPERAVNLWGYWAGNYRERLLEYTAGDADKWDPYPLMWPPRNAEEQAVAEKLEAFFAPYIAMLSRPKGNILRQLINDRMTYEDIASDSDVTRQGAWYRVQSAVRSLVKAVAIDDPDYEPPLDARRRDYTAEVDAVERMLRRYLDE